MSLLIHADGDKAVGLGHLARMRTLALRLGRPACLLTHTPDFARSVLAGTDIEIVAVTNPAGLKEAVLSRAGDAGLVVLDPPYYPDAPGRSAGPAWQSLAGQLRSMGKKVVRFTDEEAPSPHVCDVLVNGYPGADSFVEQYRGWQPSCAIFAGPRYFLIDLSHERASPVAGGLFVCLGGSDQNDLLIRYAPALRALANDFRVDIVTGSVSAFRPEHVPNADIHLYLSPDELAARLKGARLALTACGNVMFERVFHATPGVSVAQFERQNRYGLSFQRLGLTRHLGLGLAVSAAELENQLRASCEDEGLLAGQRTAAARLDIRRGCQEVIACLDALRRGSAATERVLRGY